MMNLHSYPRVEKLFEACTDARADLSFEAFQHYERGHFLPWPEKINVGGRWTTLGCKWQGEPLKNGLYVLENLTRTFDDLIVNAGYSAMAPGACITPHRGYTKEVLRFHFGLNTPLGDCQLKVGEAHFHWTYGGALLFDDTEEHSAWNNTKYDRIILLLDLKTNCL